MPSSVPRSAERILEDEAGGVMHRALLLHDLGSALAGVVAEFEYDESPLADELVKLCREFAELVESTHLTDRGALIDPIEEQPCATD